jgi:two-component system KDP operon response regulator KdpE
MAEEARHFFSWEVQMSEGSILVVSNEASIARALRLTLAAKGYEVTTAESTTEAIDLSGAGKHDLVLLDNDGSGATLEACRQIRARSDMAIIVISSDNSEEKKARAILAGADRYIAKPFGVEEIFAGVCANMRKVKTTPSQVLVS